MADVSPGGAPDPSTPTQAVPPSLPDPSGSPAAAGLSAVPAPADVPYAIGVLAAAPGAGAMVVSDAEARTASMLPVPGRGGGWRRWLPIVGVISFLFAGAVGMLIFLGVDIGITGLTVGLIAAALPVPLLVASFLWLDRYEPEPIRYLAFCFAWGAAIATAVALVVNTFSASLFGRLGLPDALVAVLVAPFIEESMKALGPILLVWRRRSEWSGITDGIVYCGMSALGFAMVENVLYLGKHGYATGVEEYGPATGLQNLFLIFIVRILFTGFAHPLFTSMTGIGLGVSSRSGDRRVRWLAPIAGLLLAMILHGTFNLLPTLASVLSQPLIMLYGYLGFMIPLFFAMVGFAIALRGWEGRLTERVLPFYVRTGWFAPPEVAALGSLGRRHSARQWARRVAGPSGQKAMRSFQFAATRLALLRDGIQRGLHTKPTDLFRSTSEEQELLTAIQAYRTAFAGRDPQTPSAFWDGAAYHLTFPDGETRTIPAPAEPVVPIPIRLPPAYAGAPYGQPAYGRPTYGMPAYGTPSYGPSGYGSQGGYGAPGYGSSGGYGAPGYGSSGGYGASGYGSSGGHGAPGYGYGAAAGYGPPGHSAPASAAPSYGAPGYGASASGTPSYGAPGPASPSYGASPSGTPGYGAPGYGGSGYGPSYAAPSAYQPGQVPGDGPTQGYPAQAGAPDGAAAAGQQDAAEGQGPPASAWQAPVTPYAAPPTPPGGRGPEPDAPPAAP
jgi:RsiW-degrading membrane proteinase PrsW (M82 family)